MNRHSNTSAAGNLLYRNADNRKRQLGLLKTAVKIIKA